METKVRNTLDALRNYNLGFVETGKRSHSAFNGEDFNPITVPPVSPFTWKTTGTSAEQNSHAFGWPTDLTYLDSGFLAVADYDAQRVKLYDSVGQARVTIAQGLIKPFGITPTLDGELIVTDQQQKCAAKFTITGKLLMTGGHGDFEEPSGIAAFQDGWWVCTDTKKHVAILYDSQGMFVKDFGGKGTGFIQMDWPGYVATDSKGRIIISDSHNFAVKLFDRNGKYLCRVGGNSKHGKLLFPKGVCVDEQDNIFVAEWGQDRVNMYNKDGRFIQHMLTYSVTRMWNPHGIAYKGNNTLAVSCRHPQPGIGVFKY